MVSLERNEPKLTTIYPVTKNDSERSINCRINFTIIDFMYESLIKDVGKTKTGYYKNLYAFLGLGQYSFEGLRNGSKADEIKWDRTYEYVKTDKLVSGEYILEITGITQKQWRGYFSNFKKIAELKEANADEKYISIVKEWKKEFEQIVFEKIRNKEMNEIAMDIYNKMSMVLFKKQLEKKSIQMAESWIKCLSDISTSDLEILYLFDREKFDKLYKNLCITAKKMEEIKQ